MFGDMYVFLLRGSSLTKGVGFCTWSVWVGVGFMGSPLTNKYTREIWSPLLLTPWPIYKFNFRSVTGEKYKETRTANFGCIDLAKTEWLKQYFKGYDSVCPQPLIRADWSRLHRDFYYWVIMPFPEVSILYSGIPPIRN